MAAGRDGVTGGVTPPRRGSSGHRPWLERRLRVAAAFLPARTRVAWDWEEPPLWPPLRLEGWASVLPRPEPDFLPPWVSLLTVAQARRSASFLDAPRFS